VGKVLYLAAQRASAIWSRPIKDRAASLHHFSIVFVGQVANR
jgi:hypothetical protein